MVYVKLVNSEGPGNFEIHFFWVIHCELSHDQRNCRKNSARYHEIAMLSL